MAAVLDMTKFTFVGKVIEAVSEMIFDDTLIGANFNDVHTIFPNIVTQTEIGFIGKGGNVGVANQGCNPTPQPWNINTRKLVWEPKTWEILLALCWTDLETSAAIYSLHTGIDIPDFEDTDYMNIVRTVLEKAMIDFWWRLTWFNDTEAEHVTDDGIVTDGVDLDFLTIIDGLWKQIWAQVGVNAAQRAATITENAGATYAAQKLDKANIQGYLESVVFGADLILRQQPDQFILVTQSVYDAYKQSLMDDSSLESARGALINGIESLSYNGIPLVAIPQWDMMIREFEDTGVKLNNPHRILYTTRSVLGVGVDNATSFDSLRIWPNFDTREVKIEAMGRSDAKLTNPELFTLGI